MTETAQLTETDAWLEAFEALEQSPPQGPAWLLPLRKAGLAQFAKTGLPTLKDEDWRFTNVDPIRQLQPNPALTRSDLDATALNQITYPHKDKDTIRLVLLDGHYQADLSDISKLPGEVTILSLAQAITEKGDSLEKHLGQYTYQNDNPFAALNTAFFQDGLYIHLPKKFQLDTPIHILNLASGDGSGAASFARHFIHAEAFSKCTILETYQAINDAAYLSAPTSEFLVDDEAFIEHIKVQDESEKAFHIASIYANIGRAAHFHSHYLTLGGRISRNNIRTKLDGEGLEAVLNGLYLSDGDQLSDHHMIVDHAKPHCDSHEYFNGILDDRARGVFHGRILVQQIAQKTDAKQTNKNLLLSDDATADTKPQLEIYADDVKCTHGATIGQLDDEAIYYLRTRGVPKPVAKRMLVHAFAGEIIDRIGHDTLREELDELVWQRLEDFTHFQSETND